MNYILIILTTLCALLSELFGLTKDGKTWKDFPNNLTIPGVLFLSLTLLFGALSIKATKNSESENVEALNGLQEKVNIQNNEIADLKDELSKFNGEFKKLQLPIPNDFKVWTTLEFNIDKISSEEQKVKFDLFESFFLFIMLHKDLEPKMYGNGKMPKTIELRTEEVSLSELKEENNLVVNRSKIGINTTIKDIQLKIVDNTTDYSSLIDMCSKFAEIRIEIPDAEGFQLEYFKVSRLSIITPNGNKLILRDIEIENGLALYNINENCWH